MIHRIGNYKIYKEISRLTDLKAKRHPMFEKNRFAKFFAYFGLLYYAAIFVLMGVLLPLIFEETNRSMAAFHTYDTYFYFLFMADFYFRFVFETTPGENVRPFMVLPLRKLFLIDMMMIESAKSAYNLFLFTFLVPFAFMSIFKFYGFAGVAGWLLGMYLLTLANAFFFHLFNSLSKISIFYLIIPVIFHLAIIALTMIPENNWLGDFFCDYLEQFIFFNPLAYSGIIAIIAALFLSTRAINARLVFQDVAKQEDIKVKKSSDMKMLNRFGMIGEYLKMEIRMRTRNKTLRTSSITMIVLTTIFCALITFTEVYDEQPFMKDFMGMYAFYGLGVIVLPTIMCHEGNYIDSLMIHKESINDLLTAKYYFNIALLLLPTILLIPTIIMGKMTIFACVSYALLTAGVIYPACFQLAVYNNNTLPMNRKITNNKNGKWFQSVTALVVMFVPLLIKQLVMIFATGNVAYGIFCVLGVIGISTHKYWIRNLYQRWMKRRYTNMEGFRASKEND